MSDAVPPPVPRPGPGWALPASVQPVGGPAYLVGWAPVPPQPLIRPIRGIGAATRWLIIAYGVLMVISMLVGGWGIAVVSAVDAGWMYAAALPPYYVLSGVVSIVSALAVLAAGICWLVWQHQAAASLPAGALRRTPGWHVGSWFIPVVSLWFPFQNISDLARASRGSLRDGVRVTWWALGIVSSVLGGIGNATLNLGHSAQAVIASLVISVARDAVMAGAAVLAWIVVARITEAIDPQTR